MFLNIGCDVVNITSKYQELNVYISEVWILKELCLLVLLAMLWFEIFTFTCYAMVWNFTFTWYAMVDMLSLAFKTLLIFLSGNGECWIFEKKIIS